MRNVTIVVPVLITNSHVSLNWKNGPAIAQIKTIVAATPKAPAVPSKRAALLASWLNTLGCLPKEEEGSTIASPWPKYDDRPTRQRPCENLH